MVTKKKRKRQKQQPKMKMHVPYVPPELIAIPLPPIDHPKLIDRRNPQ